MTGDRLCDGIAPLVRPLRAATAVALAVSVAGCALASDTPPTIDVMAVQLVGIGLTEQQLAVTVCVTNPNANRIAFRRVTAALDVSGAPLAAGASDLAVQLPPQAATVVPFTVVTTVQNLGPQLLGVLRSGSLEYRVHGTVTFQGAFGLTLPYSRSGRLDLLAQGLELASSASASASASDPVPSGCAQPARQSSLSGRRLTTGDPGGTGRQGSRNPVLASPGATAAPGHPRIA